MLLYLLFQIQPMKYPTTTKSSSVSMQIQPKILLLHYSIICLTAASAADNKNFAIKFVISVFNTGSVGISIFRVIQNTNSCRFTYEVAGHFESSMLTFQQKEQWKLKHKFISYYQ